MKLTMFTCFVASLLFFAPGAYSQAPGTGADKGKTATEKQDKLDDRFPNGRDHDFGRVARGAYCKHAFRIVNTADVPLEITSVRTASGAMKARVSKAELKPNEETTVVVLVETSRFTGPKTAAFFLTMQKRNGPAEMFQFLIKCNSDEGLKLDPKILLQNRLMEAACKGVSVDRDGFPPSPGVYLGDAKSPDIATVLKEGADVNMPDQRGETALMYAAVCGLVENVKTLLANGADPTVKTDDGWTALMFAEADHHFRVEGRREVAKVLKEHLAKKR
jgi:Ankyrin repeats (many copies)/Protein of unknown function (DUF1573)